MTNLDNGCVGAAQILINDNFSADAVSLTSSNILTCNMPTAILTATTTGTGASYQWFGPGGFAQTGPLITVDISGTYTIEVTFPNGCISQEAIEQEEDFFDPNAIINFPATLDCNNNTVVLDGSPSNSGTGAAISFQWMDQNGTTIGTNPTVNVSTAGVYELLVGNLDNGCTSTSVVVVDEDIDAPFAEAQTNNILDCNNTLVSLDGNGSSQGPNFTYIWTTNDGNIVSGATTLNPTVDAVGVYLITVLNTDNGCTSTASTIVLEDTNPPAAIITTQSSSTLDCATTSITLDATGSEQGANITYMWSTFDGNISSNPNAFSIVVDEPGSYELLVSNTSTGCTALELTIIDEDTEAPLLEPLADITVDCTNNNVTLDASSSNFNGNTITWTGPNNFSSNDFIISPGTPGTFCATVTGPNSCTSTECAVVTFDVNLPMAVANAPMPLSCANASVLLNGNGSSVGPNFTYFWSTSDGNIIVGQSTLTPEVNLAGTYTLTVLDNNSGCTSTTTVTVAPPVGIATNSSSTNISCNGLNDGMININVTQGTPPFQYNWSNGAATASLFNLSAGTYMVTITDANTCSHVEAFAITEPNPLNLNLNANGETSAGANNGNAMANVSGGTPPYTYNWSNGASTAFINNLSPGAYTVTVTDAAACTVSDVVMVMEFGCGLGLSIDVINPLCFGDNSGSITALPTAGTMPYNYIWSNGSVTQNISGVIPGTYTVTVTDASQCTVSMSGTISEPAELSANVVNIIDINCNNPVGSAEAVVTGGTPPYNFNWPDISFPTQINMPGTYTLSVVDDNDCMTTTSFTITADLDFPVVDIAPPLDLDCTVLTTTLDASASDSGPGLSISWTTQDGNIVSGGNTLTPIINAGGTYNLDITNMNNGCTSTASVFVGQNADLPAITNNGANLSLTCNAPSVTLTEAAQNPDYTYSWKDADGNILGTDPAFTFEDCGIFFLCVTDVSSDCTSFSDTIFVSCDMEGLVADAGPNQILDCNTPSVTLGGMNSSTGPDILYEWLDSSGNLVGTLATLITDVCDTYTLTLTNVNTGCTAMDEVVLTCTTGLPIVDAGEDVNIAPTCIDPDPAFPLMLDGTASDQGVSFNYMWSTQDGEIISGETTLTPTVGSIGTYQLQVVNLNTNCSAVDEVTVKIDENILIPSAMILPFGKLNCQNTAVTLDASPSIGSGNLNYTWFDGSSNSIGVGSTIQVNLPGNYTLTLSDDLTGCISEITVTVEEEEFFAEFEGQALECRLDSIIIVLEVFGEHPPFTINWTNGMQGDSVTVATDIPFSYVVTDSIGCTIEGAEILVQFDDPIFEISEVEIINSSGDNGSIDITFNGQAPPFEFLWSNGEVMEDITGLAPGIYGLTVTDANGCTFEFEYEVEAVSSIFAVDESDLLQVNPNPSTGLFYLETDIPLERIEVFSLSGKFVLSLDQVNGSTIKTIDLGKQLSGVYYLRLHSMDGNTYYKKLMLIEK